MAHPRAGHRACDAHGGDTPAARSIATEKLLTQRAQDVLADLGAVAPVDDPLSELLQLAGEALAWKQAIAAQCALLEDIRYTGGLSRNEFGELEGSGTEQLRAELALWERAMDRAEKYLVDIAKLDIDDRLAKVSEARASVLVRVLGLSLRELGHDPNDQQVAGVVLRHLRAIEG